MKDKLKTIPVPLLPTMVGACTLSNVFVNLGYTWIRHVTFILAAIVFVLYIGKILTNFQTFKDEYSQTVPSSLYAGFSMILMLLGSYVFDFQPVLGKGLWFIGLIIHAIHICIFTYRNVIKGVNMDTFVPSWFVTYNGIMVSTVVGGVMNEPTICKIVVYYGIAVFTLIIPFMIYRLIKYPIKDAVYHTQAIVLAPSSLCLVSYLNFIENPQPMIIYYLYACIVIALLFILYKLPSFFRYQFVPGYAGLTFPMAIGIVATTKFIGYMTNMNKMDVVNILKEIQGFQIYITTGIIFYVLVQFFILLKKNFKES